MFDLAKMVELRRRVEMSAWDQVTLKPAEFVEMVDELERLSGAKPELHFSGWRQPKPSIFDEIRAELEKANQHHRAEFASLHEAYAVLLEEVEEVWEITKMKEANRDLAHLRHELIQVAAMAVKAIGSIGSWKR